MPINVWRHRLEIGDVWDNDDMPLPEKGKIIIDRVKASEFWPGDDGDDLEQIIEELGDAAEEDDVDWFDLVWSAFYDWADANRVWVNTMITRKDEA